MLVRKRAFIGLAVERRSVRVQALARNILSRNILALSPACTRMVHVEKYPANNDSEIEVGGGGCRQRSKADIKQKYTPMIGLVWALSQPHTCQAMDNRS